MPKELINNKKYINISLLVIFSAVRRIIFYYVLPVTENNTIVINVAVF